VVRTRKIFDYRTVLMNAGRFCRARSPEEREVLLNMAETWESLAVAREKKLAKDGKADA
jgi:hypothetical protein